MIKCHLSRLTGEHKMRVKDVADAAGLHRNAVSLLYKKTAEPVNLSTMESLCRLFRCEISDLFEHVETQSKTRRKKAA